VYYVSCENDSFVERQLFFEWRIKWNYTFVGFLLFLTLLVTVVTRVRPMPELSDVTDTDIHRRRRRGGAGRAAAPPPNSGKNYFFGQKSCKIRAFC